MSAHPPRLCQRGYPRPSRGADSQNAVLPEDSLAPETHKDDFAAAPRDAT